MTAGTEARRRRYCLRPGPVRSVPAPGAGAPRGTAHPDDDRPSDRRRK